MVYNVAASLRVLLGIADTTAMSDANILIFQNIADGIILAYNSAPNSYGASAVELSLCRRLIMQSKSLSTFKENGIVGPSNDMPIALTKGEKTLLDGESQIWIETSESW